MSILSLRPGLFRLILATLVVLSHMTPFEIGRPAVFAFFVLSGYWVTRMYAEKYQPHGGVGVFYLSRFLRIWLPFCAAYMLALLANSMFSEIRPAFLLWGLPLFGIASTGRDVLGTSWSLDIEMQFYLAVPLLLLVLGMQLRTGTLAIGVALLCVLGWFLQLRYGLWTFLSYLPAFVVGALIWSRDYIPSHKMALGGVVLFLVVGIVVWTIPETHPLLRRDIESPIHEDWFGMVWVACLIPFIAHNVRQMSGHWDMHFGNYSYALYITHWPVIALMRETMNPLSIAERLFILSLVMVVSVTFYALIDRTLERIRAQILRGLIA